MDQNFLFLLGGLPIILLAIAAVVSSYTKLAVSMGKGLLLSAMAGALAMLITIHASESIGALSVGAGNEWISFRFDTLSSTMLLMVSMIGWIVLRFSVNYLKGDPDHLLFIRRLLLTIGLVQLLVISGSMQTFFIMWVATSFSLQYLIAFYRDRKGAQRAIRKKFLVARLSDLSLLIALIFIYRSFGTGDLEYIFGQLNAGAAVDTSNLNLAAIFLVLAAVIKSVQIPFHGWILDVMEAPTPVSALLHAGLLNAGPFLIIRFAAVMELSNVASLLLILIGGLSSVYGTVVFSSQPSVKTSLAYSSIGHMGFSLMICGMGLYAASLLHLIAHSFYKAHSFLSSGSGVDKYRLSKLSGNIAGTIAPWKIPLAIVIAAAAYVGIAELTMGVEEQSIPLLILGAMIVIGVSSFLAQSMSAENSGAIIFKSALASLLVLIAFYTFEYATNRLIAPEIPQKISTSNATTILSIVLLAVYSYTVFKPLVAPIQKGSRWDVYRRNGFYIHLVFDRMITTVYRKSSK